MKKFCLEKLILFRIESNSNLVKTVLKEIPYVFIMDEDYGCSVGVSFVDVKNAVKILEAADFNLVDYEEF